MSAPEPKAIDINCDMGEGWGRWRVAPDDQIMPFITSANVACGGHAGDPPLMAETVRLALKYGVAIGAHVSYPDLAGFGRRHMSLAPAELEAHLVSQMGALAAIASAAGARLSHIKPHGALYNEAATEQDLARLVASAVGRVSPELLIFCLPDSALWGVATTLGFAVVAEGFADRAYQPNGLLADRSVPGAVFAEPERVADQAVELAQGRVTALDGSTILLRCRTLCFHSDSPWAPASARAINLALRGAGYELSAPRRDE